ncbi:hypothetical protein [Rhodococcoides yunnanense]|uniref:hypothetical protein n=1 Tax=Rhodococcoides yunnanense TaxID=278209 RepID=UPI000934DB85|nr:hypothetical protein [Rhodococcus yunnanensis]
MPAVTNDPDWFFAVAAAADNASFTVREAITSASIALDISVTMAGNDQVGTEWGKAYDGAIGDHIRQVCQLADAYGAIASRAYLAGLNHLNAEYVAGGKQGPAPAPPAQPRSADQRVPFSPPPSAVGENGPGLNSDIPGLVAAVGVSVPNADPTRLTAAGEALDTLQALVRDKADDVLTATGSPPAGSGPDAFALHEEILSNLIAPAGHLQEEGATLASAATSFGVAVVNRRNEIVSAIDELGVSMVVTLSVGVAATLVTAGGSDLAAAGVTAARIASTGRRIYNVVRALESDVVVTTSAMTEIRAAGGLAARLSETIEKPLASFEIDEDGTIKTSPVFPKWKQDAWERYLANGGDLSMEEWSKKYDQLMANVGNGSEWDIEVGELLGYNEENGFVAQYRDPSIAEDRVWDYANTDPAVQLLVENKSGRIDYVQLEKDEEALLNGWNVQYNLRDPISPAQIARLDALAAKYPGQFTYQYLGGGG